MKLKINKPTELAQLDKEDTTVSEAISTIYHEEEGWMLTLDWNGYDILLDGIIIADIYNDLVKMLTLLHANETSFTVFFLDVGFTASWFFQVENEEIVIDPQWTSITSFDEEVIHQIREAPVIRIGKSEFIREWEQLLKMVKEDLLKAGYTDQLREFDYLNTI